eukprot:evm.model.scf_525.4 EVM.evm.TU.scf_525.4   scf_525:18232-18558(-)
MGFALQHAAQQALPSLIDIVAWDGFHPAADSPHALMRVCLFRFVCRWENYSNSPRLARPMAVSSTSQLFVGNFLATSQGIKQEEKRSRDTFTRLDITAYVLALPYNKL